MRKFPFAAGALFLFCAASAFTEDLRVKSHSLALRCDLLLRGEAPKPWSEPEILEAESRLIQEYRTVLSRSFSEHGQLRLSENFNRRRVDGDERRLELFTRLPELASGEFQYFSTNTDLRLASAADSFSGLEQLRLYRFTVSEPDAPQAEIARLADIADQNREFGRYIVRFTNGDTVSSPVSRGKATSLSMPFKILDRLFKEIRRGRVKNSAGKVFSMLDIEAVEMIHNHPRSFFFRVRTPVMTYWAGTMGLSDGIFSQDAEAWSMLSLHMHKAFPRFYAKSVQLRFTIVNAAGQVLRFAQPQGY